VALQKKQNWRLCSVTLLTVFVADDPVDPVEDSEGEGGLNWRGAFKGGVVSAVTHVLKASVSETVTLLAFNILFNVIERTEVFLKFCCLHK